MTERDRRRYLPLAMHNTVDEAVLNWLVDNKRLPVDVEVKAHLSARGNGDDYEESKLYRKALNEAVIAALEERELPSFLDEPYPDVFALIEAADWTGRRPLGMLSDDFHTLGSLMSEARKLEINTNIMFTLWHRLITEIDPELGLEIGAAGHKTNTWYHRLGHLIVKDQPAFEAYLDDEVQKRLRVGIGARAVRPLGHLLADNHPELFPKLDLE